jgi:hypothetical protein
MGLELADLDETTRQHMLTELEHDLQTNNLYFGKFLSDAGKKQYPTLLRDAIENGTDDSLAAALDAPGMFLSHHQRKTKSGVTTAKVPYTANKTLDEGEFNRFYLRGLCARAMATNQKIEIYRARASSQPRSESEELIGSQLDPGDLLEDLRTNTGVDTALGLPPRPNSGLSGRISAVGSTS